MLKLDTFTRAYVEAALWSSTDDDGVPLDNTYSPEDIALQTLEQMILDCEAFQKHLTPEEDETQAGHDFWLTRNGHGAGFWDGDWSEARGKELTDLCRPFGSFDLYVGDDGKVHGL